MKIPELTLLNELLSKEIKLVMRRMLVKMMKISCADSQCSEYCGVAWESDHDRWAEEGRS